MIERVQVALQSRGYDILIGERLMAKAGELMEGVLKSKQTIIVTDEQVARLYLHRLSNALEDRQIRYRSIILPSGEGTKSLASFSGLMERILEQQPDRRTTLIALGGGVIGDITGFAASVLLRGVDFVQIPTTLLSQVDSAVGGKTGINSQFGKNLIGSFHQPRLVISDISTLTTLPRRELMAGYAEVLKYGLINDAEFFAWLEKNAAAMQDAKNARFGECIAYAIKKSCEAKAAIVAADEREAGMRALLNFGHTFGHALEAETGFSETLLHGEAVAIGMMLALQLSARLGLCPQDDVARVAAHYQALGLPESPLFVQKQWDIEALLAHFARDKKAKDGKAAFILARGIGRAFIEENCDMQAVREILARACQSV